MMAATDSEWIDEAAGPVVRPYALTGGRTRPVRDDFDLIAIVEPAGTDPAELAAPDRQPLGPEHEMIMKVCRSSLSVAEIATELDLAVGVVRILLGDLVDHGLIRVRPPAHVARFPGERVLKDVIDGLHAL